MGTRVAGKTELAVIAGISVTLERACPGHPSTACASVDVRRLLVEYPMATPQREASRVESLGHTLGIDMSSLPRIRSTCAQSSHRQGVTQPGWSCQRQGALVVQFAGSFVPWTIELPLSADGSKTSTYFTS